MPLVNNVDNFPKSNENKAEAIKLWKSFLSIIKDNIPYISYHTWFLPIVPLDYKNYELKVQVPNNYFIDWIEEHFNTLIKSTLEKVLGENGKLLYISLGIDNYDSSFENKEKINSNLVIIKDSSVVKNVEKFSFSETNLNNKYQFENFIKGEGNQFARAAALSIGENLEKSSFNPLFIYGGVGLGKTHLIQAVGNKVYDNYTNKKVVYLSSDVFTVEFVEAIQANKVNEFSAKYKSMDVLIIDDIQFFIGKERTQDLFFHIFNDLHQSGKQIVISSDKPPKELKGLNERLISRFQWGLSVDIQPPDFETRVAILKDKSKSNGVNLGNDYLEYIAYNITSNIRELEGCLIKLLANASLNFKDIDFELVKKTVKEISSTRPSNISIEFITKKVCEFYKVDENKIREKNRKKEVAEARQVAMYLSKMLTGASLKTIGLHFGGRDHSTVIHAYNTVENQILENNSVKDKVETIKSRIELSAG